MKYAILSFVYTLLLDVLVFYSFSMKQNEVVYEFEQRQQDMQVNYAVDAASWMMLYDTPDIDIDYTNMEDIHVSPEVALETYKAIMVRSMGWGDEELTRDYFEAVHMPFFIVAAYDGYYIYGVAKDKEEVTLAGGSVVNNTTYPKIWSPKIPYAEYCGDDSNNMENNVKYVNMYMLGNSGYYRLDVNNDILEFVKYSDMTTDTSDDDKYVKTTQRDFYVATELTDACQKSLLAAKSNMDSEQIIIPSSFSQWSSNRPVEYPTVLTYMDVAGDDTKYNHVSFAIGGSRIEEQHYYITYINEKGDRCYTSSINRNQVENVRHLTIREVYTSAYECAENGYYFDVEYLQ